MLEPVNRRLGIWTVVALAVVTALMGTQLLALGRSAEAHQPEGLRMSQAQIPEPPCPYGHDPGCETARLPVLTNFDLYQSPDPHALLPAAAGRHHSTYFAGLVGIDSLRAAASDQSRSALPLANRESNGPGSDVNYAITSDITGLPWIADGVTGSEATTRDWLSLLQDHNPALVTSLVGMPFLQDHTPGDLQAIQTLAVISRGTATIDPDPQYATEIVNAPGFADGGGVDNTEAKIIAAMSIPYLDGNTTLIGELPETGTVEEQTVTGRHRNSINIAIVRLETERSNSQLMQSAQSAIADAETLMNQPLPTDFVGMLVGSLDGALGANNGISILVDPRFDAEDSNERWRQRVVGHEIGHYWWSANRYHEYWLSEGAAEYIGAYTVKSQFGDNDVHTDNYPCPYYRTIEHLRADSPQYAIEPSYGSICNYSLGERLFINLDRVMSDAAFNTAFRNLHRRLSTYENDEIDQGLSLVQAFCPQCQQQRAYQYQINLPDAGHTLARRYGEKIFTDSSPANGAVPGLGRSVAASIRDSSNYNRQYGVPQIAASSPDQRRWVTMRFDDVANPPDSATVLVVQYHEEREPWGVWLQERPVYSNDDGDAWFYPYLGAPSRRAAGHHWVHIYNENNQKVAEVEYQVLP